MKKFVAVIIAGSLIAGTVSCGRQESESTQIRNMAAAIAASVATSAIGMGLTAIPGMPPFISGLFGGGPSIQDALNAISHVSDQITAVDAKIDVITNNLEDLSKKVDEQFTIVKDKIDGVTVAVTGLYSKFGSQCTFSTDAQKALLNPVLNIVDATFNKLFDVDVENIENSQGTATVIAYKIKEALKNNTTYDIPERLLNAEKLAYDDLKNPVFSTALLDLSKVILGDEKNKTPGVLANVSFCATQKRGLLNHNDSLFRDYLGDYYINIAEKIVALSSFKEAFESKVLPQYDSSLKVRDISLSTLNDKALQFESFTRRVKLFARVIPRGQVLDTRSNKMWVLAPRTADQPNNRLTGSNVPQVNSATGYTTFYKAQQACVPTTVENYANVYFVGETNTVEKVPLKPCLVTPDDPKTYFDQSQKPGSYMQGPRIDSKIVEGGWRLPAITELKKPPSTATQLDGVYKGNALLDEWNALTICGVLHNATCSTPNEFLGGAGGPELMTTNLATPFYWTNTSQNLFDNIVTTSTGIVKPDIDSFLSSPAIVRPRQSNRENSDTFCQGGEYYGPCRSRIPNACIEGWFSWNLGGAVTPCDEPELHGWIFGGPIGTNMFRRDLFNRGGGISFRDPWKWWGQNFSEKNHEMAILDTMSKVPVDDKTVMCETLRKAQPLPHTYVSMGVINFGKPATPLMKTEDGEAFGVTDTYAYKPPQAQWDFPIDFYDYEFYNQLIGNSPTLPTTASTPSGDHSFFAASNITSDDGAYMDGRTFLCGGELKDGYPSAVYQTTLPQMANVILVRNLEQNEDYVFTDREYTTTSWSVAAKLPPAIGFMNDPSGYSVLSVNAALDSTSQRCAVDPVVEPSTWGDLESKNCNFSGFDLKPGPHRIYAMAYKTKNNIYSSMFSKDVVISDIDLPAAKPTVISNDGRTFIFKLTEMNSKYSYFCKLTANSDDAGPWNGVEYDFNWQQQSCAIPTADYDGVLSATVTTRYGTSLSSSVPVMVTPSDKPQVSTLAETSTTTSTSKPQRPNRPSVNLGALTARITVERPSDSTIFKYVVQSPEESSKSCEIILPLLSCEISNLAVGLSYTFATIAWNQNGQSESSSATAAVVGIALPLKPAGLIVDTNLNNIVVKILSDPDSTRPSKYLVVASPGNFSCSSLASEGQCVLKNAVRNKKYVIQVRSENSVGRSDFIEQNYFHTPAPKSPAELRVMASPSKLVIKIGTADLNDYSTSVKAVLTPGGKSCLIVLPLISCEIDGIDTSISYKVVATGISPSNEVALDTVFGPTKPYASVNEDTFTVDATTTTVPKVTSTTVAPNLTLSLKKAVSAKWVAAYAKMKVASTSKVSLSVSADSALYCRLSGTSLKGLKAGSCKVTVSVSPKKGKAISKTVTIKVSK